MQAELNEEGGCEDSTDRVYRWGRTAGRVQRDFVTMDTGRGKKTAVGEGEAEQGGGMVEFVGCKKEILTVGNYLIFVENVVAGGEWGIVEKFTRINATETGKEQKPCLIGLQYGR